LQSAVETCPSVVLGEADKHLLVGSESKFHMGYAYHNGAYAVCMADSSKVVVEVAFATCVMARSQFLVLRVESTSRADESSGQSGVAFDEVGDGH